MSDKLQLVVRRYKLEFIEHSQPTWPCLTLV
jgi:hypothetical protein